MKLPLAGRYFLWIGATAAALAVAAAATHAWWAYRQSQSALAQRHAERIAFGAQRISFELERLHAELLDALAEADATPAAAGEQRVKELYRLLRQQGALTRVVLLDQTGAVDAQADRLRLDADAAWPELIERARSAPLQDGRPHVLATYLHKEVQPRAVLAARRASVSRHALVAEASLSSLGAVLGQLRRAQGEAAYIVDASGQVLAHSEALAARVRLAPAGDVSTLQRIVKPDGKVVLASAGPIELLRARIVFETDEAVALAPLASSLRTGAAIVALSLLAALVLSLALARRIARPIRTIERTAERIGRGGYGLRLDASCLGELAPLARALNTMAEQIKLSQSLLEAQVAERTGELARAKEQAEEADRAKSRFLAAASHDLRQPLHAVGILATFLERRAPPGELRALTVQLSTAVDALERLFADLLDLSRLDAGRLDVEYRPVALAALFDRLAQRFRAPPGGERLRVARSRAVVESDPALLERIVQNLVANALAHGGTGRVLLGVRRCGDRVRIEVHDAGPGVPAAQREHIFEEFVRLPLGEPTPGLGLGLGLAIVRRFANALGHAVVVGDSPLGGACFGVALRCAAAPASTAPDAPAAALARLDGLFAAVIEDEALTLQSTQALLADSGCHVVGGADAAACERALADHLRLPDVIVSDFHFAGQADGFDRVVALRDRLDPMIPIVLLSGDASVLAHPAAAARLAKPASPAALAAAIAAACAPRTAAATR